MPDVYESFAAVYDELMDNVPYDEWTERIVEILNEDGITDGILCDLGCGTGNMTMRLRDAGYDMIGIDCSEEMLGIARQKQYACIDAFDEEDKELEAGLSRMREILYLLQDMRSFELFGTVRACISICDSINYILKEEQLLETFRLVNNYLDPKGLFLFDFNTDYKYREMMGDCVIAENREECSFIWENSYDREENINVIDLTLFLRQDETMYERFEESHRQKGYSLFTMKRLLQQAGLIFERAIDADTGMEVTAQSQRIFVVARENGK